MAEGTAGIEPAGEAEEVTAAKHEALELREHGKARCRHEMPRKARPGVNSRCRRERASQSPMRCHQRAGTIQG